MTEVTWMAHPNGHVCVQSLIEQYFWKQREYCFLAQLMEVGERRRSRKSAVYEQRSREGECEILLAIQISVRPRLSSLLSIKTEQQDFDYHSKGVFHKTMYDIIHALPASVRQDTQHRGALGGQSVVRGE